MAGRNSWAATGRFFGVELGDGEAERREVRALAKGFRATSFATYIRNCVAHGRDAARREPPPHTRHSTLHLAAKDATIAITACIAVDAALYIITNVHAALLAITAHGVGPAPHPRPPRPPAALAHRTTAAAALAVDVAREQAARVAHGGRAAALGVGALVPAEGFAMPGVRRAERRGGGGGGGAAGGS